MRDLITNSEDMTFSEWICAAAKAVNPYPIDFVDIALQMHKAWEMGEDPTEYTYVFVRVNPEAKIA